MTGAKSDRCSPTSVRQGFRLRRSHRRGQRRPQTNVYERLPLENALDDVRDIRKIWQKHFGKSYAPRNGPSAISIAAQRHGLSEDELVSFRKNRHRFRKNRQRKR